MENRIWHLFSKKLTNEASSSELMELNNLLSAHPECYQVLQDMETLWHAGEASSTSEQIDQEFGLLLKKMKDCGLGIEPEASTETDGLVADEPKPRTTRKMVIGILLAMAAAAVYFLYGFYFAPNPVIQDQPSQQADVNQVVTRAGSRSKVVLPDGTQVWLNGDSKLTYGNDFGKTTRNVTLTGEAFFDVAHNKKVPFYINTSRINIKVTGTSFNVRAYPSESKSETSIIEGKVEVRVNDQPDKTYFLKPNEKLVVSNDLDTPGNQSEAGSENLKQKLLTVRAAAVTPFIKQLVIDADEKIPVETAWVNNTLAFSDESFREVADKMEKWYGVNIRFSSPGIEQIRFTGRFEHETIHQSLAAMQLTTPFQFSIQHNNVIISQSTIKK